MAARRKRDRRTSRERGSDLQENDVPVPLETADVDGDFNGAPELAGVEASQQWEASDVLDAMEGLESGDDDGLATWEAEVAARREVLLSRMSEAQAVGLGELFETTALLMGPDDEGAPLVVDLEELQGRVARLDAALAALEAALAGGGVAAGAGAPGGAGASRAAAAGHAAEGGGAHAGVAATRAAEPEVASEIGAAEADIAATGAAEAAAAAGAWPQVPSQRRWGDTQERSGDAASRPPRRSRAERIAGWGALALVVAGGAWLARGRRFARATRTRG